MDSDLFLVIGVMLGGFSIPSILSAFAESRPPRLGAIMIIAAGALIVMAVSRKPGGYEVAEVPQAFYRVIGQFLN